MIPVVEKGEEFNLYLDENELRRQLIEGFQDEPKKTESNAESAGGEGNVQENVSKYIMDEIKRRQKRQRQLRKSKVLRIRHDLKHFTASLGTTLSSCTEKWSEEAETEKEMIAKKEKRGSESIVGTLEMDFEVILDVVCGAP